jgi:radical SAM-linked protein
MQQIKLRYKKGEQIRFISHRDLMRLMQRAIRRAELPVTYSQGFNPHIRISWGNALKVGQTSDNEYATLKFDTWVKPLAIMDQLNQNLPEGLEILEAFVV